MCRHATLAIALAIVLVMAFAPQGSAVTFDLPARCEQPRGGQTFAPLIRRAWSERKWEDKSPVSDRQAKRIRTHRRCARNGKALNAMVNMAVRQRKQFREHRQEQLRKRRTDCIPGVTIYAGLGGCWSIPTEIVACESGGSWSAYNPSGASGPYQLLGWGAPMPADTIAKKKEHHRIAHRLWAGGSGRGHWVC